jgi:hypothetical protein
MHKFKDNFRKNTNGSEITVEVNGQTGLEFPLSNRGLASDKMAVAPVTISLLALSHYVLFYSICFAVK